METLLVEIDFFSKKIFMEIFNYDFYKNKQILNEGLDIISKELKSSNNCWEPFQTEITKEILKNGNNLFIDIGCHIGYYSILGSIYNNNVISIDNNPVFLESLKKNIEINDFKNISVYNKNINELFNLDELVDINQKIKLIKCDIEGNEIIFINSIKDRLKLGTIEYLIIEISPKLSNGYENLIRILLDYNYKIFDIGLSPQRKLNNNTTLFNLKALEINFKTNHQIIDFLNNLEHGQTNLLFQLQ